MFGNLGMLQSYASLCLQNMRCGLLHSSILDYVAISWGFQLDPGHVGLTPEQMRPMIPEKTLNSGLSPQNFPSSFSTHLWIFHIEPLWLMFHSIRIIPPFRDLFTVYVAFLVWDVLLSLIKILDLTQDLENPLSVNSLLWSDLDVTWAQVQIVGHYFYIGMVSLC